MVTLGVCLAGLPAIASADDFDSEPCTTDVVAALSGQGQWLVAASGTPAWQPSPAVVGYDFVPYQTGGTWMDRDGVQVFASQWPWGDLVFSDGNWTFDSEQGWLWLPDSRCVQIGAPTVAGQMMMPVVLLPANARMANHPWGAHPLSGERPGRPPSSGGRVAPPPARPVAVAPNRSASPGRSFPNPHRQH